jgi:DNA-binding transcriptional regulator YdaS (Cro superfamily)
MRSPALLKAIEKAGSVTKLATLLDVAPQAISQWFRAPAGRVLEIERVTGVLRHELRPDIYPPEDAPKRRSKRSGSQPQAAG